MANTQFNYGQKLKGRVITDPTLKRFIWANHTFGTKYNEPFTHASVKSNSSQTYLFAESIRPVRSLELDFQTLVYAGAEAINCPDALNYAKLQAFYLEHGLYKPFIYPHPVYGDMKVRFARPIVLPKKNPNSKTIQSLSITLMEVVDTDYFFDPDEDLSGKIPFPCGFYDVEIEYREDTLAAPLGGNYTMIFKDNKPQLRTVKVSVDGLQYFRNECDCLSFDYAPWQNAALLEVFYLQHRLQNTFYLEYAGEQLKLRFKEPLVITKPTPDSGLLPTIDLVFIESPFEQFKVSDIDG